MIKKIKNALFKNRNARQTVAKNVFWLSAGQIGSRLFRALIIIYAARVLGATEYGVFSYVLGLAGFFTIFADFGINALLTREVAKKPEEQPYYFATIFWIKMVLLFFTAILVIFLAPQFSKIEGAEVLLPFVALLVFFDGVREFVIAFFRSKEKMELEALVTTVTNVAITIFGFTILYFASTAQALAVTYILSASTGAIIGVVILRKLFAGVFVYFKKSLVTLSMKAALPMAFIGIIGVFMLQIDILMLGALTTAQTIGFYSAGQKIIQLLYTFPAILSTALFPSMSKFVGQEDRFKSRLVIERGFTVVFLLAVPLTIGGVILGKNIIDFLYGSEYLPGVLPFQILILSLLPVFPSYMIGNYIFSYDLQKKALPYVALGSVINVVMNIIFIPTHGATGAAVATLITQIIYNGAMWRLAKKVNNFYTLVHLKKIIVAGVLMGAISLAMNQLQVHLLFNIFISAAAYFFMLYVLKEKSILEIKTLLTRGGGADIPISQT